MKEKFTKLMAALVLLVFMIPSMAGWGQATTYSSNVTLPNVSSPLSSCKVVINDVEYEGIKIGTNSNKTGSFDILVPDGTTKLYIHSAAWSGKNSTLSLTTTQADVTISPSTTWSLTADGGVSGNSTTYTLSNQEYASTYYFKEYTLTGVTTATTITIANGTERAVVWGINAETDGNSGMATLTQSNLALTGSYTTNTEKTINGITYVYTDLMKSNDNIQAKASSGTIRNTTAYPGDITSVAITHDGTARATTINGSADGSNWTQVATGSGSITADFTGRGYKYFQITRGSYAAYWTKIDITYSTETSALDPSDLTITSQSTDLTFDLYNNTTAQVISYTTSSTGAITITPAESDYFSYVHDAAAKTITVTPTAVTPSEQTVTISQAADENYSAGAATFTVSVANSAPVLDYATLPFSFNGGSAGIATTSGLTYEGLGNDYSSSPKLRFDDTGDWLILHFNERPGNLSFDIKGNSFSGSTFKVQVSADGVTYTDFVTYTDLPGTNEGSQHVSINHLAEEVRYIKWVYAEKVNGNVALGNIALDVYEAPQAYTLFIADADDVAILTQGITNGGSATVYSGTLVTLEVRITPGYILDEVIVLDENGQPVTLTQVSEGYWSFYMPDSDVMVSAVMVVAHAPVYYNLATTIQSGKRYIIVGKNNGVYYAMGAQKTNINDIQTNRAAKLITVEGTTASVTRSDVYDFTISLESDGTYSIYDEEAQGYLYVPNSTNNYIGTYTGLDENGKWTITFDPETGAATVVANNKTMQYNTSNKLFSCYASGSQDPVYLYKINDEFTFDVIGYTSTKDHYYLIASPVTVDPATVEGMTTGDYDLYYFDPSQEKEWINYKGDAALDNPGGFWLEPGKGYLYAKKATADHPTYSFGLSGELYEGDGTFDLVPGWNLVGNPYKEVAELSCSDDFYVINETELGSELIAGDDWNIQPLTGLFVYSDEPDALVTFSRIRSGAKPAGLSLNLAKGRSVVDRAIVRFGEGKQLPKFQLNESSTKLYIPQGNQDFAVVRSAGEGEMPVSFKAEKDGTYTLSMSADEVTFDYLHLIDNMTGMDVDLLQTPSYTFEARTSDYTSRFRLIVSANDGDSVVDETFAFFNGSGWTVSNLGEATLQVVDVMGRVVSSQSINGNATISLNEAAGIYMFRLINGENVKVQKVVVR